MSAERERASAVQVSRGILVALVAGLAAATLLVAFLVGRESARTSSQAPPTSVAAQAAVPASETPRPPAAGAASPWPWPSDSPVPSLAASPALAPPAQQGPTLASPPPPGPPTPAAPDKLRDDVARYFREVEAIQSQAKSGGDPEALARTLLEQGVKGAESGFNGLSAANRKVLDALRGVAVPEPCREHHRLTLGLMEESIAMLDRVKGQLHGTDEGSLAALPAQGRELERKAKEVDAMAADIKRRYGL